VCRSIIPFAKYVPLMSAGKELINDPALALHFGEAFDLSIGESSGQLPIRGPG
jgi:hypothetical protein